LAKLFSDAVLVHVILRRECRNARKRFVFALCVCYSYEFGGTQAYGKILTMQCLLNMPCSPLS